MIVLEGVSKYIEVGLTLVVVVVNFIRSYLPN